MDTQIGLLGEKYSHKLIFSIFCLYLFFEAKIQGEDSITPRSIMEIRRNHLLQDSNTIWLQRDEGSCQKIFHILKIIRVFGILSAISSMRNLQRKISARSWTRTRSQELRPLQQFRQCCNSSHKLQERSNRKSQSGRGREDNHSQTSLTQEERHSISTE